MKEWNQMTEKEKVKLNTYRKYLLIENPNDDQEAQSLALTEFCLMNDLCVSEIPQRLLYDEIYQKIHLASPESFKNLYGGIVWVNENNEEIEMV